MIHKNKAHCQTVSNTIHRSEQSRLPDRGGSTKWVHLHSWLVGKKKKSKTIISMFSEIVFSLLIRTMYLF